MAAYFHPWPEAAAPGALPAPAVDPPSGDPRRDGRGGELPAPRLDDGVEGAGEDGTLMSRMAVGDTEAFAAFYDRHSSLFFGLVCRILGDEQEAEDVVQEACVSLWERAPQYDPSLGRPLSWAITLLRNRAIDRLRSRKRRSAVITGADENGELPEPPAELRAAPATDLADTATLVRQTLLHLPGSQRQALEMAFFGGLTHLEIAQNLSVPLGTIKARIRRGLLALRDTLEGRL